jgi:anti-anti-sigma factor
MKPSVRALDISTDEDLFIELEGPLYFASQSYFGAEIARMLAAAPGTKHLIIQGQRLNYIDASGEWALAGLASHLREVQVGLHFCGLSQTCREVLTRSGLTEECFELHFHDDLDEAQSILSSRNTEREPS